MRLKMSKQIQDAYRVATTRAPASKSPCGMFRNIRPDDFARLGISWSGGKVVGLPHGELMPYGVSVADWVVEEGRR